LKSDRTPLRRKPIGKTFAATIPEKSGLMDHLPPEEMNEELRAYYDGNEGAHP